MLDFYVSSRFGGLTDKYVPFPSILKERPRDMREKDYAKNCDRAIDEWIMDELAAECYYDNK